jgi:hypothetical protein
MATDKNKHLDCVLSSHKITQEEKLLKKHRDQRTEVREFLQEKYGNNIHNPFDSGSYAKNTAVNTKFDFDLVIPFKKSSSTTLKEMYDDLFSALNEKYRDSANVRAQKVSIGLEFFSDDDNHTINIDVVPGRELNQDQFLEDRKLNLYVNKQYGILEEGSDRLRTNVNAQIDNIKNRVESTDIRKVIRLLKVWKVNNNGIMKSFLIELITIKAFDSEGISGTLWDKLKAVLEYVKDNIETVTLSDPGNSSNNVSDTLTVNDKSSLKQDMAFILNRIEGNDDNIKYYFPINEKFPCNEGKGKYGIKEAGYSIPPATKFG